MALNKVTDTKQANTWKKIIVVTLQAHISEHGRKIEIETEWVKKSLDAQPRFPGEKRRLSVITLYLKSGWVTCLS